MLCLAMGSVAHRPAELAAPGSRLEMQSQAPPCPPKPDLGFVCTSWLPEERCPGAQERRGRRGLPAPGRGRCQRSGNPPHSGPCLVPSLPAGCFRGQEAAPDRLLHPCSCWSELGAPGEALGEAAGRRGKSPVSSAVVLLVGQALARPPPHPLPFCSPGVPAASSLLRS